MSARSCFQDKQHINASNKINHVSGGGREGGRRSCWGRHWCFDSEREMMPGEGMECHCRRGRKLMVGWIDRAGMFKRMS